MVMILIIVLILLDHRKESLVTLWCLLLTDNIVLSKMCPSENLKHGDQFKGKPLSCFHVVAYERQ